MSLTFCTIVRTNLSIQKDDFDLEKMAIDTGVKSFLGSMPALTAACFAIGPQSTAFRTLAVVAADGVATGLLTAAVLHLTFVNIWKKRIKKPDFYR